MTHRILAFDLGSNMAYAKNFGQTVSAHREFKGGRRVALPGIYGWLMPMVRWDPDVVVYERPFARGEAATRMLWGIAGLIEAVFGDVAAVVDYTPAEIKKFSTGSGKADKDKMTFAAQLLGYEGDNEHEADAFCLLKFSEATIKKG